MNSKWPIFFDSQANALLDTIVQTLAHERTLFDVYPEDTHLFKAFESCPYDKLKVIILGQDPYHTVGCANGLAFSVPQGVKCPPSLKNIFKELYDDCGITRLNTDLSDWANQGVLLLNTCLSVRAHHAHSHAHLGWEKWVQLVLKQLNDDPRPYCFVLWGNHAQKCGTLITNSHHKVLQSAHPSPLSAYQGFFNSKPFSKINAFTQHHYQTTITWSDPQ